MPRPTSVTLLALLVLCIGVYHALGAAAAIQGYTVLQEMPLALPPAYLLGRGVVWALAFAALAVGLWRQRHWGRLGAPVALTLYVAAGWVERLVFAQSDYAQVSAPCFALLQGLALAAVWGLLLRRQTRQSFTE
jgi:hypothetical protein